MNGTFWYRAFGLLFHSELSLPEYRDSVPGEADVTIRMGDFASRVRKALEAEVADICGAHHTPHGVLLHVERVGDFIIRDGREIDVSPLPDVEINLLRLYLVGSVMAVLFHQRGQFIFHGAAILVKHGVDVFVGPSGSGKSTLVSHLTSAGYPALADDTLPIQVRDDAVIAWPGAQIFKMWEDALHGIGKDTGDLPHVSQRYGKFFFENPLPAEDRPLPVRNVFALDRGDTFQIEPITGLDAVGILNENTYRREFIGFLGLEPQYLAQLGSITEKLAFYRFTRPDDPNRLPEAISALETHWNETN